MDMSGRDHRQLTNDAFSLDFGVLAITDRIVDEPLARQQLRRLIADIFEAHEVRENEL